MLVCLGMNVGGHWGSTGAIGLAISQELKPRLDVRIRWVQFRRSLVGIQSIINLVVAAFILHNHVSRYSTVCKDVSDLPKSQDHTKPRR